MTMYRVRANLSGSPVSNGLMTIHYDQGGGTAQQAVTATANLLGTWTPFYQAAQNIDVDSVVDEISEADGQLVGQQTVTGASVSTTGTDQALPPANQMLVRLETGQIISGRFLKGRIFVPGLTELANLTGGLVDPALISGSAAALAAWVGSANAIPVVWHRPGVHGPGTFAPVLSATIWSRWALLRKRRD